MLSSPKPGQRVQLWYGHPHRDTMPHHGKAGVVVFAGKGRPRNHLVRLADGTLVIVPAGNIRAAPLAGQ